jgi:RNA-binding protein YhbY
LTLSSSERAAKRGQAQRLTTSMQVGKAGVTEATLAELRGQLKRHKLVKVRLLPAATEGGDTTQAQAEALAAATQSELVEVRGSTAVFWRG